MVHVGGQEWVVRLEESGLSSLRLEEGLWCDWPGFEVPGGGGRILSFQYPNCCHHGREGGPAAPQPGGGGGQGCLRGVGLQVEVG